MLAYFLLMFTAVSKMPTAPPPAPVVPKPPPPRAAPNEGAALWLPDYLPPC
jgi:hypothetical protein